MNFFCDENEIRTQKYSVKFLKDRHYLKLIDSKGEILGEFFIISSINESEHEDVALKVIDKNFTIEDERIKVSYNIKSNIWEEKIIDFHFLEDRFYYMIKVKGKGHLKDIEYFSSHYTESLRWSAGRFYSKLLVDKIFNPEPYVDENYYHNPMESSSIDLNGVPIWGKDGWFFTPPPFCFALIKNNTCFSMGIKCNAGENNYTSFNFIGGRGNYLSLNYEGHTEINGEFTSPKVAFIFGEDEYKVLGEYCREIAIKVNKTNFSWWREPIFCGWGAQGALSQVKNKPTPEFSSEESYYYFLNYLSEKNIEAGTIVIDDKWQKNYGICDVDDKKWPDMKGFIEYAHSKGKKVLLWLKAWDKEGLEDFLCIKDESGFALAVDPTNRDYKLFFKERIKYMLHKDFLNADGFKIDFTARIPTGPYIKKSGNIWGLELMREYLKIIYLSSKNVKEDALIIAHCPNPYLEDVFDMVRLNDINTSSNINNAMIHRAKVAKLACPNLLIDTDNWPMPNKKAWEDYMDIQPELGVPSIYYLTSIDNSKEAIDEEGLSKLKNMITRYKEKGL